MEEELLSRLNAPSKLRKQVSLRAGLRDYQNKPVGFAEVTDLIPQIAVVANSRGRRMRPGGGPPG